MRTLLLTLLTLSACGGASAQFQPAQVAAPGKPRAALYAAALNVLVERGAAAESKDETAGVIVTQWEESTMFETKYRRRWQVAVSDGQVRVDSKCEFEEVSAITGNKSWSACGETREEAERTNVARQMASDIAARATGGQQPR